MKAKEISRIALMIAVLSVCAQLAVPIGPVPITLQTLGVMTLGYTLTPKQAVVATTLYMVMGLAGIPIFSGGGGSLQSFLTPSFGFIIGYIPMTYAMARIQAKNTNNTWQGYVKGGIIGNIILYAIGVTYMYCILNYYMNTSIGVGAALMVGMIPFIPGDILKACVAVMIARRVNAAFPHHVYKNN